MASDQLVRVRGRSGRAAGTPDREVVLVDLYWTRDKDPRVPLGHASLLAELARAGVRAHSLARPVQACHGVEALAAEIEARCRARDASAVDVALGVYVWNEELTGPLVHGRL